MFILAAEMQLINKKKKKTVSNSHLTPPLICNLHIETFICLSIYWSLCFFMFHTNKKGLFILESTWAKGLHLLRKISKQIHK